MFEPVAGALEASETARIGWTPCSRPERAHVNPTTGRLTRTHLDVMAHLKRHSPSHTRQGVDGPLEQRLARETAAAASCNQVGAALGVWSLLVQYLSSSQHCTSSMQGTAGQPACAPHGLGLGLFSVQPKFDRGIFEFPNGSPCCWVPILSRTWPAENKMVSTN